MTVGSYSHKKEVTKQ